jgi:hypothetical protein
MKDKIASVPGDTPLEVVFRMKALTEGDIGVRQLIARAALGLVVLALAAAMLCVPLANPSMPQFVTVAVRASLTLVVSFVVGYAFMSIPELRFAHYHWLQSTDCDELADLCEQNPGLVPYRDQVLALGRRFTRGEYEAMSAWVAKQQAKAARAEADARANAGCKRLYGIAQV